MSESDPIDLSNLMNLQFRPDWVEDLSKKDAAPGEVVWGRAPGARFREDREDRPRRDGAGPPRRDGGRGFDRGPRPDSRGPRPGGPPRGDQRGPRPDNRGPRPDFRPGPPGQGERRPPPRGDGPPRGDFRGPRRDDRGGRPPFRQDERRGPWRDDSHGAPALEGWQVSLLPEARTLDSVARQIKASGRAFSVFDVGRLFMQKREHYLVRFARMGPPAPQKSADGQPVPAPAPRGPETILQCTADGTLWLSRDEAIRHILHSPALEKYYRTEVVTVDAPKGNWTAVAVCGFSGALLGPPNHHDYQRNVARLHRERFSDMSLDRFKSRIRVEKDEALLAKWQEQLSSITQYVPVPAEPLPEGAEPPAPLKSMAEMEAHFLRTHAAEAVTSVTKATVPGTIPGKCLSPALLTLLRREVENQQRFPMQLVQDLCRALESQGLRFFKRDKRSTFVSRNRPHFLPDDLSLSERIRTMVEIVRANPGIKYSRLVSILAPNVVLSSPEPPPPQEAAPAAAANEDTAPVAAATPAPEPPAPEPPAPESPEPAAVAASVAEEAVPVAVEAAVPAEEAGAEVPEVAAEAGEAFTVPQEAAPEASTGETVEAGVKPAPAPVTHLSPEEIAILQDLRWLVQEGYVTEFQNGELFVLGRPPQPPAEKKPRGPRPEKAAAAKDAAPSGPAGEAPAAAEIENVDAAAITAAVPETPAEEAPPSPAETPPPAEPAAD